MFFTSPKNRTKELLHFLHKKYKYNRDLLSNKKLEQYLQLKTDINASLTGSIAAEGFEVQFKDFEDRAGKLFPEDKDSSIKENIEVLFVAVVIALALRTFFLQPFVIPTDSMKPTLYGIPVAETTQNPPGFLKSVTDFLFFGTSYVQVHVEKGGRVREISDTGPWGINILGDIPFIDRTRLVIGDQTYILSGSVNEFQKGCSLRPGMTVADNSIPVSYVFGAGDHVFVNKFIYHFRKPDRGDVFVFTTEHIRRIEESLSGGVSSQFYIKRCVGLPGDELQVKPPYLLSNGKTLESRPIFQKIYSKKDGYEGYSNEAGSLFLRTPEDTYHLAKNGYWAMGDNSYHSFDSRFWGAVPAENLVGTGLLVYWPFSSRWGLIP